MAVATECSFLRDLLRKVLAWQEGKDELQRNEELCFDYGEVSPALREREDPV